MNYNVRAIEARRHEWQGIKHALMIGFSIGGALLFTLSMMSSIAHN